MEEHKGFPNFWVAVLILVLLLGLQILISIAAYDLGFRYELGDPGAAGIITVLSCGVVFSVLMSYKKIGYRDLFNPTKNSAFTTIAVLLVPLMLTVGGAVFWVSDVTNLLLLHFPADESEYVMLSRLMSGGVVSIILVCVIAPVIEEMLFRGIILRSFLTNYSVIRAIALSSLLFAVFHLTITQLPVAFIVGCLFGWLYVRTRSLWPSILGHVLYNACAMLLWSTYYTPNSQDVAFSPEFNSIGVIVASILSSIIGVIMLMYILKPGVRACP